MPDTPAFLPLRRKAPAVAESDLLRARRGAADALQGSTGAKVDLRAPATPGPSRGGLFRGVADHGVAAQSAKTPNLNGDLENPERRSDLIGACLLIALAVLTATTELPLIWLARLAEALR